MSHVCQLTHIVLTIKYRNPTIKEHCCEQLYRYITTFFKERNCKVLIINGISNHIHILVNMHQNYSLADTIRDLKHQSSLWMRNSADFIDFKGWSSEYFACSVSPRAQDAVIEYIKNQKEHHKKVTADDEYIQLLRNAGIPFNGFMPQ